VSSFATWPSSTDWPCVHKPHPSHSKANRATSATLQINYRPIIFWRAPCFAPGSACELMSSWCGRSTTHPVDGTIRPRGHGRVCHPGRDLTRHSELLAPEGGARPQALRKPASRLTTFIFARVPCGLSTALRATTKACRCTRRRSRKTPPSRRRTLAWLSLTPSGRISSSSIMRKLGQECESPRKRPLGSTLFWARRMRPWRLHMIAMRDGKKRR
jgi:hypothetical protein